MSQLNPIARYLKTQWLGPQLVFKDRDNDNAIDDGEILIKKTRAPVDTWALAFLKNELEIADILPPPPTDSTPPDSFSLCVSNHQALLCEGQTFTNSDVFLGKGALSYFLEFDKTQQKLIFKKQSSSPNDLPVNIDLSRSSFLLSAQGESFDKIIWRTRAKEADIPINQYLGHSYLYTNDPLFFKAEALDRDLEAQNKISSSIFLRIFKDLDIRVSNKGYRSLNPTDHTVDPKKVPINELLSDLVNSSRAKTLDGSPLEQSLSLLDDCWKNGEDARILVFKPKEDQSSFKINLGTGTINRHFHAAVLFNGKVYGYGEKFNDLKLDDYLKQAFPNNDIDVLVSNRNSAEPEFEKKISVTLDYITRAKEETEKSQVCATPTIHGIPAYPTYNSATSTRTPLSLLTTEDIPDSLKGVIQEGGIDISNNSSFSADLSKLNETHISRIEEGKKEAWADYFNCIHHNDVTHIKDALNNEQDTFRKGLLDQRLQTFQTQNPLLAGDAVYSEWVDDLKFTQYKIRTADAANAPTAHVISLEGRAIRPLTRYTHSFGVFQTLEAEKQNLFPNIDSNNPPIKRVLIIGPGIEYINPDLGSQIPAQVLEPYVVIDKLVSSGLANLDDLKVDVTDLNSDPLDLLDLQQQQAAQNKPIDLYITQSKDFTLTDTSAGNIVPNPIYQEAFKQFADTIKTVSQQEILPPDHDPLVVKKVTIPSNAVEPIHTIFANMTTDRFETGAYDLVICLNTIPYFSPHEQALAYANISQALKPGGIFLTDETNLTTAQIPLLTYTQRDIPIAQNSAGESFGYKVTIFKK